MRMDDGLVERIKLEADILSIIGRSVTLKKKGADHFGLCPFHQEKTPSFKVNPARRRYKCFGCGASGSVIDWVMHNSGVQFVDAVKILAAELGISTESERTGLPMKRFKNAASSRAEKQDTKKPWVDLSNSRENLLKTLAKENSRTSAWLSRKNISKKIVRGLCEKGLIGEIHDGKPVFFYPRGVKIRREIEDSRSSYWAEGFPDLPWSPDMTPVIEPVNRVYLCEGESDAMRLMTVMAALKDPAVDGLVMSIPSASWTPAPEVCFAMGAFRIVTLCFDGDHAGREATRRIAEQLNKHGKCRYVSDLELPDGKDICELPENDLIKMLYRPQKLI